MTASRLLEHPWALTREALNGLQTAIPAPGVEPEARRTSAGQRKAVGLIRITGVIEKNPFWGGVDIDLVSQIFGEFASDESVGGIVLHVDSPGGGVFGLEEFGKQIIDARKRKPVVAVADGLMASAAYWIGASATKVVATPSSLVGSIGIFKLHVDASKALEDAGLKPTLISAGKYKTEGNPLEPLSDDARDHEQELVDSYYSKFVKGVAKGRGVKTSEVRNGFGEGRVLTADRALEEGMVDEIGSVASAIDELGSDSAAVAAQALDVRRRRFSLTRQKIGV